MELPWLVGMLLRGQKLARVVEEATGVAWYQVKKSIDDRILEEELLERIEEAMKAEAYKEDLMVRDILAQGGAPPGPKRIPGIPHTEQCEVAPDEPPETGVASEDAASDPSTPVQSGDGPSPEARPDGVLAPTTGSGDGGVDTAPPVHDGEGSSGAALANEARASSAGASDMAMEGYIGNGTHIDAQPSQEQNLSSAAPGVLQRPGVDGNTTTAATASDTTGLQEPVQDGALTKSRGAEASALGDGGRLPLRLQESSQDGRGSLKNAAEETAGEELLGIKPSEEMVERILAERRALRAQAGT